MTGKDAGPRLGRGLAALLGELPSISPSAGVREMPVELLEPGPFQPRAPLEADSLAELTESVKARGILQPLLARPHPTSSGRFQIIAGERRWRAAQLAGLHEVPTLVRGLSDADAMAGALVENLQRKDLNAIEEAEGYRRLGTEFGLKQDQLARAVGKSRSHVANTVRLLNLPSPVQEEVRKGSLSAGHARALLMHPEPQKAALAVISRGLNVRQTEALVAGRPAPASEELRRPAGRNKETEALERELAEKLGLRVQIGHRGPGGTVQLHYSSLDQLDGLVALLSRA